MQFKVSSELAYEVKSPSTFIFNILASKTPNQKVLQESLILDPQIPFEEFTSQDESTRFLRVKVKDNISFKISYNATVDVQYRFVNQAHAQEDVKVEYLDADLIPFLFPSRYCQSDRLQRLAYKEFGQIDDVYSKVAAISNWIYNNVEYLSGSTNASTSAVDTILERAGVCRDFAHLGIALCRSLSIPARYFTGYAFQLNPPDFHACFEAYINDRWIFFDPTRLVAINGLVKIANGRDAADAAVASIFGNTICTLMNVQCEAIDADYQPYFYQENDLQSISYQL